MRRAKGIHHKHFAQRRHLFGQRVVVILFTLVEAHVFKQHHFAVRHLHAIQPILDQAHLGAQMLGQFFRNRRQRIFLVVHAFLRPPQVRHHHHLGARSHQKLDGRDGGIDACFIRDLAVFHRHVEVGANQYVDTGEISEFFQLDD